MWVFSRAHHLHTNTLARTAPTATKVSSQRLRSALRALLAATAIDQGARRLQGCVVLDITALVERSSLHLWMESQELSAHQGGTAQVRCILYNLWCSPLTTMHCAAGSSTPQICPSGTASTTIGAKAPSECTAVGRGLYSTVVALGASVLPCDSGYVCTGGASTAAPNDATGYMCPPGVACPNGTQYEVPCAPGSYNPHYQASSCLPVSPGYYTATYNSTSQLQCTPGSYCPAGSTAPQPCPAGSYSTTSGLSSVSECTPCPATRYCPNAGQTTVGGSCAAGFVCAAGSTSATQAPCPSGHYCLSGSSPVPCTAGTFLGTTGASTAAACTSCTPGSYCATAGLTAPTALCQQGYYCTGGATTATQHTCTAGNQCPEGSVAPQPCGVGTYQQASGAGSCTPCPAGYTCSSDSQPAACPLRKYCPAGSSVESAPYCPNGTLGSQTGLSTPEECTACPAGKYCLQGIVAGDVSEGLYCASGCATPSGSPAVQCRPGHYCPTGTPAMMACPLGRYNPSYSKTSITDCLPCWAGHR